MSDSYKVKVNDSFEFDIEKEHAVQLDAVTIETNKFHVLHQETPYLAEIVSANFNQKKYTVKVNNNSYTVAIADNLDLLIKEMGFEVGLAKQINAIKAPMPGLILEISVVVGQTVKENEPLLILEAMKMENSFQSPRDGVIKSIAVSKGDAVDKGQLLIEFE
ncbi:biotin carboxyl carrier protein [Flavobacterium sp. 7E]|uniref:acetyl-CoA carboxylase biotin carboxyl carrier protein subunit n=1 Tax=unclassified Flavobacterium TaxID=196869 RepID=UPI00156EC792|nr:MULTISPECIES: acetyl-CoA carboxylase biotin carboxyl carrier protein subunit [unclassified Flavobacterium]MBE0390943.1 Glutaconyl-CoA decarboxylase subunit gamma [Flavobacterium sp. PL002]NRS89223.1 biotin carboxyl carrier protein [Flavobacterium sp. 7E]